MKRRSAAGEGDHSIARVWHTVPLHEEILDWPLTLLSSPGAPWEEDVELKRKYVPDSESKREKKNNWHDVKCWL